MPLSNQLDWDKKNKKRDWKRCRKLQLFFLRKRLGGVSMTNLQTTKNRIRRKHKTEAVISVWSSAMAEFSYFFFVHIWKRQDMRKRQKSTRKALCFVLRHRTRAKSPEASRGPWAQPALHNHATAYLSTNLDWKANIFHFCFCRKHNAFNPFSRMDIFLW